MALDLIAFSLSASLHPDIRSDFVSLFILNELFRIRDIGVQG